MKSTKMAKNTWGRRLASGALCLCMALALFAGLGLYAPVQAQAANSGTVATALQPDNTGAQRSVYFGSTPIKWRIVANDGNTVTLLSDGSVASRQYDPSQHNSWSGSEICAWLNGTGSFSTNGFLVIAFTLGEKSAMATQYGVADEPYGQGESWAGTIDSRQAIVLPSVDEMKDGGSWSMDATTRLISGTVQWLRTPGNGTHAAAYIGALSGGVSATGTGVAGPSGIRPAFKINLTSVLFTSAAAGGKPNAGAGGALVGAAAPTGDLKLTILDAATTLAVSNVVQTGDSFTFDYTATGTYSDLSAMVRGADGAVKYYGRLENTPAASGVQGSSAVQLPTGLAAGDKLEVFAEQINGANLTDYASAPQTLYPTPPAPQPQPNPNPPVEDPTDTFWRGVLGQMAALGTNGSLKVDAAAHSYVPHYILQHLHNNGGQTLTITHGLGTFVLTKARLARAGILVDNNYTFEQLKAAGLLGSGSPQTGDSSNLPLWALCGGVAVLGLALCGMALRRRFGRKAG